MKIALLTIWHEKNYGAELQAYATIRALKELGHNVELINICLSDFSQRTIKARIIKLVSSLLPAHKKFNRFWKKYFNASRKYTSLRDLYSNPPNADVYMVGSDQVWNPDITKSLYKIFFLDFGDKAIKRISYASSFGVNRWQHPEMIENIGRLLDNFNALSCREKTGCEILLSTFSQHSERVLDPTLLFDDYYELTGKIIEKDILTYYPLGKGENVELKMAATRIAEKMGIIPINANWQRRIVGPILYDRNSIENWIKNIAESKFVITPSFHGVAMSLIYHRQFAVIIANKQRASRITDLLSSIGLKHRVFYSIAELESAKPWETVIDYTNITMQLEKMRNNSISYLKKSLSNEYTNRK